MLMTGTPPKSHLLGLKHSLYHTQALEEVLVLGLEWAWLL